MSTSAVLTRLGAFEATQHVDRLANLIEIEASVLGIDPELSKLAIDVLDKVSDAVEQKAAANFPLVAGELPPALQKINDEKAEEKAPKKEATFDPSMIAEQTSGPLESDSDESYMDGRFTQVDLYEMSEEFGGRLASASKTAASKLESVTVLGYDGFTGQIRQLEELSTQAATLQAQIDAAVAPLLATKAGLDADIAKVHKVIKDEYKASLSAVGNVTIERKTSLVAARAQLQVVAVKRSLNDVQAELLAAVIEKYGKEVADYIKVTSGALQDVDKQMRVAFKGFELEQRAMQAHTASAGKTSGLADLLATFQAWLSKGWQKMVQVAKTVTSIVTRSGASCAAAHDQYMGTIDDLASGKTASAAPAVTSHGFNLFKI